MGETLEHVTFKGEALSLSLAWVDNLFQGKELVWDLLIAHEINRAESSQAEQVLDDITALYNTPY
jgi:hypothetical protein